MKALTQFFKLLVLPCLLFCPLRAYAGQHGQSAEPGVSKAEMAHEERLWNAQKTLEAGKLEEAEKLYRIILGQEKDDPRALLGLARVFKKMAQRDGVHPPGMKELMGRMQSIIDAQGVGVAKMQERLRRQDRSSEKETPGRQEFSESDSELARKEIRKRWERQPVSPSLKKMERPIGRVWVEQRQLFGSALLFRGDCPEPEFKDWYFLDPPS